ncbi:PAS/PAC sensor hybrid histidine kinase (modular protein) [Hyella patelloides LEGE 07179]|uniref:histidine kinase n=1 Tax=Hyella patelloides LEGE 07179 TaxID=945734 RepID=A0A563VMI7_9CYAN|nr:PAS domain S-box protein [Hyella patelloides]VEP12666.1 PAS/PAC sensor hybrid histidine kinase (modular protein) [Hyella patelloides LEGE 07179]
MCINNFIERNLLIVAPDTLLSDVTALMSQKRQKSLAGCVLVVAAAQLIGILTQSDVIKSIAQGFDITATTVERVMKSPVITVAYSQCDDIQSVCAVLQQHSISYLPVLGDSQEIIGVLSAKSLFQSLVNQNSDLALAEEKLAKSENLLRMIVESEPECVKLLDREGKLLEINPAELAIIEADSLAEILGKSFYPLVNPQHRQAFIELTESVFEGKSGRLEFKLTGLKGTPRWLETNAVPLRDGNRITALLAVTRDISEQQTALRERKNTELQLQQERDFSKAIINTVDALIAVLDHQGTIVSFNHTCEQVTGYSSTEIKGQQIWENLVAPEEKSTVKAVFERLLAGEVPNQYTNYWLAKDGTRHLISWSNTALFDAQGKVNFIIATGIDISEQRRFWNKLEHQYRQTKLLAEITRKIRISIDIEEILQTTVTEVQHLLTCDRVLIVEILPNNTALAISEAILPNLPPMLGYELVDPLLIGEQLAKYRQGEILAINNLATAAIATEIKQLLKQFQIQAKLVVPILSQNQIKGLLVAHQCHNPREWQKNEISLLTQLANQIGIALSHAQLLDNLESMVAERTVELTTTNQLLKEEIAEREQTEAALRENQQKLTGILDNADEAIISIDQQQQIQMFNRGAEKIFGYKATEIIGKSLDILLPEVFRQIHRTHVDYFSKSALQSRTMAERNSNVSGLRKNGEQFPAAASIAKLKTREGLLLTVMLKDITEQQQAKEKLQASQDLLTKAEKIAKIGSWEYNFAPQQLGWSEELFEILGFPKNRSVPPCEDILNRVYPADLLLVKKTLRQGHQEGKPWHFNYRFILPNGTIKYLESRGEPTVNSQGKVLKVWGTVMDISQRIEAEKSLQRSEEQLRLITDGLPVLIAYIDKQQHYLYNNRTYETWFGRPRSTLLGLEIADLFSADDYQKMLPYIKTALSGKVVSFEFQSTNENGHPYWMNATYIPDFDANNEVQGFFSMIDDITDRKQIERMKSEFVSIASHEMRTPLTSIYGVVKLLSAGHLGELSPAGVKMANMALKNSDRLINLVNDILDLERIESGRDQIEKQQCNSTELIQQAIDTIGSTAQNYQIVLQDNTPALEFLADSDRIVQTLSNLISNAIKFSPENSKIWITCQQQNKNILFTVKDRGRGIPHDKLETIFERFQQVDASDSRKKGGTGLGLAICRHIVEQHGGEIWAESIYGEGSTFFFTIPQQFE